MGEDSDRFRGRHANVDARLMGFARTRRNGLAAARGAFEDNGLTFQLRPAAEQPLQGPVG